MQNALTNARIIIQSYVPSICSPFRLPTNALTNATEADKVKVVGYLLCNEQIKISSDDINVRTYVRTWHIM